ncbi:hypothetical protein [Plantactinospora sp. GCM10030261]|uniref:hypothetical protein n=1 Tax=Plantactinospora sp. GCM10030261 TaxID=3273420 RepID=UPI0036187846
MKNVDDLRHALETETAGLSVNLPAELVRTRARRVRTRRAALVTASALLAVGALTVPMVSLPGGSSTRYEAGAVPCPTGPAVAPLGTPVETGAVLNAADNTPRWDVLLNLGGFPDNPLFGVEFRDRVTGTRGVWDTVDLVRAPNGDIAGKRGGDPTFRFYSAQLALGGTDVLDVGVYAGRAGAVTVASGGRAADATISLNEATGWTLFWVRRPATPSPPDADAGAVESEGPGGLTLTAYDGAGRRLATVTGGFLVGAAVQNPRDGQSAQEAPGSTGAPASAGC